MKQNIFTTGWLTWKRIHGVLWACLLTGFISSIAIGAPVSESFDSNGVLIHYTVEGQGEPVVLIHGLYSSADMNWRTPGTIRLLAAKYQVIALDMRGHGQSGKPEAEKDYGVEMEEDIVRLLDHLKISKAHVAGYSMGGLVVMKLLVKHPDRVRSAALGGMGWLKEGSPLQEFWGNMPGRSRSRTPTACVRSFGALAVTEAEVKAIHLPITVLIGDHDPVRKLYVQPLQNIRPDVPVTVVDGAGHLNCIFKTQFQEGLKLWLDQHAGR